MQVVTVDDNRQDPFVREHIRPCTRLWDALEPYRSKVGNVEIPHPVKDRLIFTEAATALNTVASREALLAAALFGSASRQQQVHDVMLAHKYILTLDYTMKMLHLEVNAGCGMKRQLHLHTSAH